MAGTNTRDFDGTDDKITLSTGGLSALDGGAITIAALVKLDATDGPVFWGGSTSAQADRRFCLEVSGGSWFYDTSSGNFQSLFTGAVSENWAVIGVTKANGTTTPRGHKFIYDTNTWTHVNAAGTLVDAGSGPGAGGVLIIGNGGTSGFLNGKIGAIGVWTSELSDADFETLDNGLQAWLNLSPVEVWRLDQDTVTPISSLTGSANETAITGTAVIADVPAQFSWILGTQPTPPLITLAPRTVYR